MTTPDEYTLAIKYGKRTLFDGEVDTINCQLSREAITLEAINSVILDVTQPVQSHLPPGWVVVAPDAVRCPDCSARTGSI